MKKFLSVLCVMAFSLGLSAQVYYLLPNSDDQNCEQVTNVYDNTRGENMLQWETCFIEGQGDVPQCPERHAYEWLKDVYNQGDKYITYKDLTDGRLAPEGDLRGDVKVLWVNVDRWMDKGEFDALFPEAVREALGVFVKDGGHLYLSTFASRLVWLIGRTQAEQGIFAEKNGFGGCDINDQWKLKAHAFGEDYDIDRHEHAIYKYLNATEGAYIDNYRYHMQKGTVRTDRNCVYDFFGNAQNQINFEAANHAVVLGGWGHEPIVNCGGIIEFQPVGEWTGTILMNGLAACSFAAGNEDVDYLKLLTQGVLEYLESVEPEVGPEPQPEEGVIFSGNHRVSWDTPLDFEAAKFADAKAGDKIVVTYTDATDGMEFKIPVVWHHLAGSRQALWTNGDGTVEQFLTPKAVEQLQANGLQVVGANFICKKIELLGGKAELKEGITAWTGYFWADEWSTLELWPEAYNTVNFDSIDAIRFYSEAENGSYVLNFLEHWEEGGKFADQTNMTDGEGYKELALTDELRTRLAAASHWMIQFNKEGLAPFNVTDVVLIETEPQGFENIDASAKTVKVMKDGQLYILKGDKIYNALGVEVK